MGFFIKDGQLYGNATKINVDNALNAESLNAISNAAVAEAFSKIKSNSIITVGFSEDCSYQCDGENDNIEIQAAIDYAHSIGGGTVQVQPGEYNINCVVYMKSHVHLYANNATFIANKQWDFELDTPTTVESYDVTVSEEILKHLSVGQEIGFTDGSTGYITDETKGQHNFITGIQGNVITVEYRIKHSFTHIVSLTSLFRADKGLKVWQGDNDNDIQIIGGTYDGNLSEGDVKIADMCSNGLIFGGIANLIIENVEIKNTGFQGMHYTGVITDYSKVGYISNCVAHNCGGAGICLDSVKNIQVLNCHSYNNIFGLQLVETSNCSIIGGQYYDNSFCGIRVVGSVDPDYNTMIANVYVKHNSYGIGVNNENYCCITNSIIEGNTTYGIALEENTKNSVISNSCFYNNITALFENSDGTEGNYLSGLVFNGNTINKIINSAIDLDNKTNTNSSEELNKEYKTLNATEEVYDKYSYKVASFNYPSTKIIINKQISDTDTSLLLVGKNKFDYSKYIENIQDYQGYLGMKLIVKPNTKYTCSTEDKSGNTVYFGQNLDIGVEENGGNLTATSDENGYLYIWILPDRVNYDEYTKGAKWIQIEEGEIATDFESYVNNIEYTIDKTLTEKQLSIPAKSFTIYSTQDILVKPLNIKEDLYSVASLIGNDDISKIGNGTITNAINTLYNLISSK